MNPTTITKWHTHQSPEATMQAKWHQKKEIYIEWLCAEHFALTSHTLYVYYADIRQPLNNMINQIWHGRTKLSEKNDCIMWYDTMIKRREQIADSQSIVIAFNSILSWVVVEFLASQAKDWTDVYTIYWHLFTHTHIYP